ncbi:unnamed protein product [Dovyalis caffra]|uniref:DUF4219 domain-containing protein n=1 Tax=Dovyalis caffra TaxID=77055 RepID=A0AAV1QXJ7_9ROSI|nr:unnamed protein product [Dovyalis caffra]
MATNIAPTAIVVEVLRDDNYDDWSACMKSYMLAQDLLDFIEPTDHQEGDQEVDSRALRKKNAAALHAIQISCAPHILSEIRDITSAKSAWDTLANLPKKHSPSQKEQSVEEGSDSSGDGSQSTREQGSESLGDGSQSKRDESEAPDQENGGMPCLILFIS